MACVGKPTLTPKAIIHQRFGAKASYKVEEVHDSSQNGCPGLAIPQKGPCLYRCHLQLPDFSVVSNVFKKKKDAEQSAAEMALEKLGIRPRNNNLTVDEAWVDIVGRVKYIFSDEFLSSGHPLGSHLTAALRRDGDLCGTVPVSVIATFDSKINSRCKMINPLVDSDPFLVISYVMKAAEELSDFVVASTGAASIRRSNAYPSSILEALTTQVSDSSESIKIEAVRIPCNLEVAVEPVTLDISSSQYYLDIVAEKLGLKDGSHILISRTVGKASSETRLYSAIPTWRSLDLSSKASGLSDAEESSKKSRNARASYVCGQDIYGDAIMASVGYSWKSHDLDCSDVNLKSYYRICLGMSPNGIYKISRQAILTAQLPASFTTRTNWRGSFPREILCMFCRQNQLAEPVFSASTTPLRSLSDMLRSHKKMKVSDLLESEVEYSDRKNEDLPGSGDGYRCEVKVLSKSQDLVLECSLRKFFKKQNDSIQNASLKVLSWFDKFFKDLDADPDELDASIVDEDIQLHHQDFLKGTSSRVKVCDFHREVRRENSLDLSTMSMPCAEKCQFVESATNGPDSGVYPSNSSLVCLCYSVSLATNGEFGKELIESNEEIEFEVGTGAMIPCLESVVTQMSVGQHACFATALPAEEMILAAAADTLRTRSLLSSESSYLEYSILLLGVKEPPEERMEEALFSPPLSKQRVEYALKHIRESSATSLVDFGCGSGSLLNCLLDYPTSLETIIGVDISPKGLARAAKMLHSKLNTSANNIKSAKLYDGSIIEFDSRLHDFDIGTCLEVIEHMEEEQACQFGDTVLSSFCPKLLIVSTPNYEYNTILQRANLESQEEDPEDKLPSQLPKFRNHDHKFEWTREQFNHWASELAKRHKYSVEFSGVGGSGDVEPGFASQIAVFRRGSVAGGDDAAKVKNSGGLYRVIWQWSSDDRDKTNL